MASSGSFAAPHDLESERQTVPTSELLTNECGVTCGRGCSGGQYLLTFHGLRRSRHWRVLARRQEMLIALLPQAWSSFRHHPGERRQVVPPTPIPSRLRRHDLSPALARRKTHRPATQVAIKLPFAFPLPCRRQRLRFFQRSRDGRLRAPHPAKPTSILLSQK